MGARTAAGAAQGDLGGVARAGRRAAVRRRPGRVVDPGDTRRAEPLGTPWAGPGGALGAGRDAGGELRTERHRARLPARPPHPARRLLGVLAVDLATARFAGGIHAGAGGELPRTAGTRA